jgi:hypothetical protein
MRTPGVRAGSGPFGAVGVIWVAGCGAPPGEGEEHFVEAGLVNLHGGDTDVGGI